MKCARHKIHLGTCMPELNKNSLDYTLTRQSMPHQNYQGKP
jgi:hypothetical protein